MRWLRPGNDLPTAEEFADEIRDHLRYERGVDLAFATDNDLYQALGRTVRAHLMQSWLDSLQAQFAAHARFVVYLSAEYLLGKQLDNNLLCTGLAEVAAGALELLGTDLDRLRRVEVEPGLGNGGLGRLAACFLDSLATLRIPAVGYGIRYEFGIFRQTFLDGWQSEQPDDWLRLGFPWEFAHPEQSVVVGFGGHTEHRPRGDGTIDVRWLPDTTVRGVPYNVMVPGYESGTVNTLRLWSARSTEELDLQFFNDGDYTRAVQRKIQSETICKVLYPNDATAQGRELRLRQQYFFVACSLRDVIDVHLRGDTMEHLPDRVVVQLNDTHPVIAVPELMRLLMDDHGQTWDRAWQVTQQVFAYTCHTLLPEALETWPIGLLWRLLPRHVEIIGEIDRRFRELVRTTYPGDDDRVQRMAIIGDGSEPVVRMAHLATVASFRVNGVAELHSQLLREHVLRDFAELWPSKFTNVTNGVTPRRFLRVANPRLSDLVTEAVGPGWVNDLDQLRALEPLAGDAGFQERWRQVKLANKQALAAIVQERRGYAPDTAALFDVMVKRMHLYKRQLLKVLHVVTQYQRLRDDPDAEVVPRLVVVGAKAAPGYWLAKQVVKLINAVGDVVNADPLVDGRLRVAYLRNYDVTLAECIIPAADLSEQISTAGKEASGTGNMKLALNGALTIGTLDGANVEIRELVGPEHFFLFGLTEAEVAATLAEGYRPRSCYEADPELRCAIDAIAGGTFSGGDAGMFRPVVDHLLHDDPFLVLADYRAYVDAQDLVDAAYLDVAGWTRSSILNTARCGFFSSDRSIREYLERVWRAWPIDTAEWWAAHPRPELRRAPG